MPSIHTQIVNEGLNKLSMYAQVYYEKVAIQAVSEEIEKMVRREVARQISTNPELQTALTLLATEKMTELLGKK